MAYFIFRSFVFFFSFVSFSYLKYFSRLFYLLTFKIFRFRRSQVFSDLKFCFPQKSFTEIRSLEKKIYESTCDVLCEALKSYSMTPKDLLPYFSVKNPELLNQYFREGSSCLIFFSHSGNWEWLSALGFLFPSKIMCTYKRIHNSSIDKFIKKRREFFGAEMIEQKKVLRTLIKVRKDQKNPKAFIMIGDQRPKAGQDFQEISFLGRKTRFLTGTEKLAQKLQLPVLYMRMKRTKTHHYELEFQKIKESPKVTLTEALAHQLEEDIYSAPELWFWLHERWKP